MNSIVLIFLNVLLYCAVFWATCLATPLQELLHKILPNHVKYHGTVENPVRQVAEISAESRTQFYFLQQFQATINFVTESHKPVAKLSTLEIFFEALPCVTAPKSPPNLYVV